MNILRSSWPRIGEFWFDEPILSEGLDVAILRQFEDPPVDAPAVPFHTIIIDLRQSDDEIFSGMKSKTRNLVRRAQANGEIKIEAFEKPEHSAIDEFLEVHRTFSERRGLPPVDSSWVNSLAEAGALALTRAIAFGDTLVWHSYVVTRSRARLLHSASLFRDADHSVQNLVGLANRLLHWSDMKMFRAARLDTYDLGGWYDGTEDPALLSINRFKESFGGLQKKEYNATKALSLLGRTYLEAMKIRNMRWH
jgi:hypothetical protein